LKEIYIHTSTFDLHLLIYKCVILESENLSVSNKQNPVFVTVVS